ncbi:MAG TPA: glycosyltransferase family 87 protein [Candidatus Limnocylindrales bacterium]
MGPRRARLWLSAAAIAGYLPALGAPLRHWFDFAAFYTGGRLVFQRSLLDPLAVVLLQVQQGLPPTPFVSPPFLALAYAPLTALPYDLAALIQVVAMAAALVAGALLWADALGLPRRWALLGALAWGPASASVASGQVDTLALLLSGAAVRLLADGRRSAAGLAIALLAFKPQVTFGAGLGALPRLGRRGTATLLAGGAALYVLAAVAVGGDLAWPGRWVATLQSYSAADFAANGWQASSPVSLGLRAAIAVGDPLLAAAGVALGVGVAVGVAWWSLRRWSPPSGAADIAMWTAIGLLLSPHLWVYDATLLLPAIGALAAAAGRAGWPATDRALLTVVFAAGALWPFGGFLGITFVPLALVAIPLRLGLSGHMAVQGGAGIVTVDSPS